MVEALLTDGAPRMVCGVTRNDPHRSRGTRPARRATRARSDQVKRGRATWRQSTGQLVAQDEDLGIFRGGVRAVDAHDPEDAPHETVEEGSGPQGGASSSASWLVKLGRRVSGPFRDLHYETQSGTFSLLALGRAALHQEAIITESRVSSR